ncbi:hypothetical protein R5W24_003332 [Gemmata sp. JC717]|uniref:hypothetical protein n=1 Tax=Gemmata algarum TaxID=2975278 RepID=UPI0021BA6E97|nr:hypothetical protein [Gemmata algarum]MDY3554213.1 hypothetical protein [Gemmata algarum]
MEVLHVFLWQSFCIRLLAIASGTFCLYLGYRLFSLPLKKAPESELSGSRGDTKFVLRSTAPGIFFALFGATVVGVTITRSVEFSLPPKGTEDKINATEKQQIKSYGPNTPPITAGYTDPNAIWRADPKGTPSTIAVPTSGRD